MLVGFWVQNFRSFKDRQTFSMVAGSFREHRYTHTFATGKNTSAKNATGLLRSAVVYGPNAAGKTNLLRAIGLMQSFVINSAKSTAPYPYTPFKLAKGRQLKPSEFHISFIQDENRYEYGFALGPDRIESESLVAYALSGGKTRRRLMFERTWERGKKQYRWKFGPSLKGQRTVWRESTRPDSLFLSTAIQLNSTQLLPVFSWFQKKLVVIVGATELNRSLTVQMLEKPDGKDLVLSFLKQADLGIADIEVKKEPIPPGGGVVIQPHALMQTNPTGGHLITVSLSHISEDKKTLVQIPFDEESSGTRVLFRAAGAWVNVLTNGEVLLFDEIDRSMHPSLLRFLVRRFHSSASNPKNAQLVCTIHNTSLLDQRLYRRDQVWFVEKEVSGASNLYPLTEFRPRSEEVLETWYMRGRYGAQPALPLDGD